MVHVKSASTKKGSPDNLQKDAPQNPRQKIKALVYVGMNSWDHQAINDSVRFLAHATTAVDCLYLNPPQGLRNALQAGAGWRNSRHWLIQQEEEVTLFDPPWGFLPVALGLRDWAEGQAAKQLAQLLTERYGQQWREVVLVYISSWSYTQTNFIRQLKPQHLIFHILDDSFAFPLIRDHPRVLAENEKFYQYLMLESSLILGVSEEIIQKYQRLYARKVHLLRNGVDVEFFQKPRLDSSISVPEELQALPQPILLYVGSINSWVDLPLLQSLAQARPQYSLVLVGHCYPEYQQLPEWQDLLRLPNVRWLGTKAFSQIPAYLHGAQVLLLPRTLAEHSQASDPLKLYEYLATGKPVVSTGLPALETFRQVVYTTQNASDFVQKVEQAWQTDNQQRQEQQITLAGQHTWQARLQEIAALVAKYSNVELPT